MRLEPLAALLAVLAAAGLATAAPPFASFTVEPVAPAPGEPFVANASASADPDGGRIAKFEWRLEREPFRVGNASETFVVNGTAVVRIELRVTDEDGEGATVSQYVTVGSPPSRAIFDASAIGRHFGVLLTGAVVTLELALLAILLGLPIGVVVALGRLSRAAPVRFLATLYVEVLRGSPLLLQVIAWYFAPPVLTLALNARYDWVPIVRLTAFQAGLIALLINTSAYQGEIIRAGIQAIPSGQTEAALSLGMRRGQAMRLVVLPQAFRLIAPPMTNEFIVLLKDTSLVSVIGLAPPELFGTGRFIMSRTYEVVEVLVAVAMIYIAMTWSLSQLLRWLERRYRIPGLGVQA